MNSFLGTAVVAGDTGAPHDGHGSFVGRVRGSR